MEENKEPKRSPHKWSLTKEQKQHNDNDLGCDNDFLATAPLVQRKKKLVISRDSWKMNKKKTSALWKVIKRESTG
jgi:hypothetical protein